MVFVDYDQQLENVEKMIQEADYSKENKQIIFDFENHLFMNGLKKATIQNNIFYIHSFFQVVNKPFSQLQKRDIESYVRYIQRNLNTDYSRMTSKAILKKFFRWYHNGKDPEITNQINISYKNVKRKLPDQLLTSDEVKTMIDAASYLRDKALIAVLYDTGAKISEIGNLQIKDITFDQYGAILKVDGKTGMRRVRVFQRAISFELA